MTGAFTYQHLRLCRMSEMMEHSSQTMRFGTLGNEGFGRYMREPSAAPSTPAVADLHLVYHSWLPRMMAMSDEQAAAIRCLIRDEPADASTQAIAATLHAMGWCQDEPVDLDHLLNRVASEIMAIQNRYELRAFLEIVRRARPKTVIEIGTARGGTLYALSQLADPSAVILSIDLPGAPNGGGQSALERELFKSFGPIGQRLTCLPLDSHEPATFEAARAALDGRAVDLLFIDGDHSYEGVRADFERYRTLVAPDGLIALHDINVFPEQFGAANAVGPFWRELTAQYATEAIEDPDGVCAPTRPPGKRAAWGIGLVRDAGSAGG